MSFYIFLGCSIVLLSIVIPYHYSRSSLKILLDSIPEWDWIEVLVVNDNSDDVSDVVSAHSRTKYFIQSINKKWAGAARNLGIKHARGDYVVFADADDFFTPNAFEIIRKNLDSGYDLLFYSPISIKLDASVSNRHIRYQELVHDFINNKSDSIKYRFHVPWSKVIKRDLIINNNIYFDEVIASNDVNFSLKISYYSVKTYAFDKNIYCVVESDNSLTKKKNEIIVDARFDAVCRYNDFLFEKQDVNYSPMLLHLVSAYRFSFYKFLSRFFYCKYKKYKIFPSLSHMIELIRRR
jgi:glycosyltransferase involved in cell wall biosynthesis